MQQMMIGVVGVAVGALTGAWVAVAVGAIGVLVGASADPGTVDGVEAPDVVDAPPVTLDVALQLASASTTSSSATPASQIEESRNRKGEAEPSMWSIPFFAIDAHSTQEAALPKRASLAYPLASISRLRPALYELGHSSWQLASAL
jgi:hypothetical protein